MSIATDLQKLETDITNAYDAVQTKGGTIPSDKNTNNLPTAISSISGGGGKPEQSKTATPTTSSQIILPDEGYTLSSVTVNAVTSSIDNNIKASNIKEGVSILGVEGNIRVPSGTIEITENGTYNVTNYETAEINMPDFLELFLTDNLKVYKSIKATNIKNNLFNSGAFVHLSFPNVNHIGGYNFFGLKYLKFAYVGKIKTLNSGNVLVAVHDIKTIVIGTKGLCTLSGKWSNSNNIVKGIALFYVPDKDENNNDLPSQYKQATNWSIYSEQIKGYSEAPLFDSTKSYVDGDVVQYQNKFYAYWEKVDSSASGKYPSGDTTGNDYWDYIADIN